MRRPIVPCVATITIAAIVLATSVPAFAAFTADQLRCRSAVAKAGRKLAKAAAKAVSDCHRFRNTGAGALDCNAFESADLGDELPGAESKFTTAVSERCGDILPADVLYQQCPAPCDDAVPVLSSFADVAACLTCLNRARIEELSDEAFRDPTVPLEGPPSKCHRAVTKNASRFLDAIVKNVARCQASAEKDGAMTVTGCTETDYELEVAAARDKAETKIRRGPCNDGQLEEALDPCGSANNASELSVCVATVVDTSGKSLVTDFLWLPTTTTSTTTTTTTTTTSTTIPVGDPQCPGGAELILLSRHSNLACTTNTDCAAPRTCDAALGHCVSATEDARGWSGLHHEADRNDGVRLPVRLYCPGPAGPTCGSCDIVGLDPAAGSCRCAADPRQICDNPFNPHSSDCPGNGACECYAGPPIPLSAGGTPFCLVERLTGHPGGTIDADSGDVVLDSALSARIFLGTTSIQPCPTCGGTCSNNPSATCERDFDCPGGTCDLDSVAGDGIRGGTCLRGSSDGLSCDVMGTNASLPAFAVSEGGRGGGYSLDCLPSPAMNISGSGLKVDLSQGTGSDSLVASLSCTGPAAGLDCPCLVCNADPTIACSDDTDCAAMTGCSSNPVHQCGTNSDCSAADVGTCHPFLHRCTGWISQSCTVDADCQGVDLGTCEASTCSTEGFGAYPLPNACEDQLCSDLGGAEGECTSGPDDRYCDGVTTADGRGLLACQTNTDCTPASVGLDGGDCSIEQRRPCFVDPIVANGSASASAPLLAGTYCLPPTSSTVVNQVVGLPGPARQIQQTTMALRCAGDPMSAYTPGVGGCP